MTTMTGVFLANNFKAVVPEEVASLIYKFSDVCDDDDGEYILFRPLVLARFWR